MTARGVAGTKQLEFERLTAFEAVYRLVDIDPDGRVDGDLAELKPSEFTKDTFRSTIVSVLLRSRRAGC